MSHLKFIQQQVGIVCVRVRLVIMLVCKPQAKNGWITNELGKDVEESSTDLVQSTIIELRGTKRQLRNIKQGILFPSGETNAWARSSAVNRGTPSRPVRYRVFTAWCSHSHLKPWTCLGFFDLYTGSYRHEIITPQLHWGGAELEHLWPP